jgi:hypothetical protein
VNTLSNSKALVRPVVSPDGRVLASSTGHWTCHFMLVVAPRMNLNSFVRRKVGRGEADCIRWSLRLRRNGAGEMWPPFLLANFASRV